MSERVWIFTLFQKKKCTQLDVEGNYISVPIEPIFFLKPLRQPCSILFIIPGLQILNAVCKYCIGIWEISKASSEPSRLSVYEAFE